MKEPKRLLSHGATDFERQLLRAVAAERPSALLRSRMQRSLGLVGPLAWASNVKAMFGSVSSRISGSRLAAGAAVAAVVVAGGIAAYQALPERADEPELTAPAAASAPMAAVETAAATEVEGRAVNHPGADAPAVDAPAAVPPGAAPDGVASAPAAAPDAPAAAPAVAGESEDNRLREEIALLDGVKAALQRGEREQARQSLDTYRERFPDGILRREANVLRRRAEARAARGSDVASDTAD